MFTKYKHFLRDFKVPKERNSVFIFFKNVLCTHRIIMFISTVDVCVSAYVRMNVNTGDLNTQRFLIVSFSFLFFFKKREKILKVKGLQLFF